MTRFAPTDLDELRDAVARRSPPRSRWRSSAAGRSAALGRPLQTAAYARPVAPLRHPRLRAERTGADRRRRDAARRDRARARRRGPDARVRAARLARRCSAAASDSAEPTLGGVARLQPLGPAAHQGRARRATISSAFARSAAAAKSSRPAARSSRTSPATICRKLMAGSYGTLAALEEVTVKVLPRPETVATVLFAASRPTPRQCG